MKKNNFLPPGINRLLVAGLFLIGAPLAVAQTSKDAATLRSQTKVEVMKRSRAIAEKTLPTAAELNKFAAEQNVKNRAVEKDGTIVQLAGIEGNGNPIYRITTNEKAAITAKVDRIRKGGATGYELSGKDVKVAEWDGGRVRATHRELVGKITRGVDTGKYITESLSSHSTHVAGTILATGIDPRAKGMAPEASIISYDFDNPYEELITSLENQEAVLSTHSYGYGVGWGIIGGLWGWFGDPNVSTVTDYKFGYYSEYDWYVDEILRSAPWHTYVRSAGNDKGDGPGGTKQEIDGGAMGYDTVPFGSLSKNVIVVGAAKPVLNYEGPQSVEITDFSSRGPADDGRILPTVVADGFNVYSSSAESDIAYAVMSGTSMSTPSTTGSLALIQEFAKRKTGRYFSSPLVKALLINTTQEAGNPGPDYTFGFGLINAKAAVEAIDYKGKNSEYREGNLTNGETITLKFKTQKGVPFKASLAWLDKGGTPKAWVSDEKPKDSTFLNDRTPKLVDDLDMRIEQNGKVYMPYKLDPNAPEKTATTGDNIVDNQEQIYIENPETGTVTLTITHKGTLDDDGVNYGLSVTGMPVANDLEVVAVEKMDPNDTETSTNTAIAIKVRNNGGIAAGPYSVKVTVKDPADKVVFQTTAQAQSIPAAGMAKVFVDVPLPKLFTTYTVTAEVVYEKDVLAGNNSASILLTPVVADLREGGAMMLEDFNHTTVEEHGWKIVNMDPATATWTITNNEGTLDGSPYALNFAGGSAPADDWLLTNPVLVKKGATYKVSYLTKKNSYGTVREENYEIYIGDKQETASMTKLLDKYTFDQAANNAIIKKVEFTFTAEQDGKVYFGIRHYSSQGKTSWSGSVDNFKVINTLPGKPTPDFTYTIADKTPFVSKYNSIILQNQTEANPPATKYEWLFYPDTVTFLNGTNANSENPEVRFNNEGRYAITLKVTNALGTGETTKYNYVEVLAPTTTAGFTVDRNLIYTGENIQFTNTSFGYPEPKAFKWIITPNEPGAFEFIEGTTPESAHINVKFIKGGTYTVTLNAISASGTYSKTMSNVITVVANDNAPLNARATKEDNPPVVTVDWDKPEWMYPASYIRQDFTSRVFPPAGWQVIDANKDGQGWSWAMYTNSNNEPLAACRGQKNDDYLVTPVIEDAPLEYNELTFVSEVLPPHYATTPMLALYYIPTDKKGPLTVEEIKAGTRIDLTSKVFMRQSLASVMDGKPFRLAFYCFKTTPFSYSVDKVRLSKPGTIKGFPGPITLSDGVGGLRQEDAEGNILPIENALPTKPSWESILNVSTSSAPLNNITSYQVFRNSALIGLTDSSNTIFVDNTIKAAGNYCYSIHAVYDGVNISKPSNDVCVTVSTGSLGTSEIDAKGAGIYPNPVVDFVKVKLAKKVSGKVEINLYSMSGQKVLSKSASQASLEQEGINLSGLTTGTYVIVVKSEDINYTAKLIKK